MALSVDIEKKLGNFHLRAKFKAGNEILSILGASGCGKSMTLKCIAGIEKPDKGKIVLDGVTLFDSEKRINLPPQKRKVGYLFQQYALFPGMTVEQNIACGVRDKRKKESIVQTFIHAMNLDGMEKKKPYQLSGGQQQRVALARILANKPEVVLLDEPFSALDSFLRFQLEREVHGIMRDFGKTVILVSHDRDEVFRLSDCIATMRDGMIDTIGDKQEVFKNPKTKSGAILTGCKNISQAKKIDPEHIYVNDWDLTIRVLEIPEDIKYAGIRMHDIKAVNEKCENSFVCNVTGEIENPFSYIVILDPQDKNAKTPIGVELDKSEWERMRGSQLTVCLPSDKILLLKE